MAEFSDLNTAWFAIIGLLWAGYFFLEGFDFGVAVVAPIVSRDDLDRRICLNAVGPTWDGNEVWLIVAGGATFAAFPLWYAKLFSGFYLALFVVLVALIARGVSFEFRDKVDSRSWRTFWDGANLLGSLVPAVVWGAAFTDLVHGLPLDPGGTYRGGLVGLLHPVALVGGLASLALFSLHGAVFLALKTEGTVRDRAVRLVRVLVPASVVLLAAVLGWLVHAGRPSVGGSLPAAVPVVLALLAALAVVGTGVLSARSRPGLAFAANGLAILLVTGAAFSRLFPAVLASGTVASHGLTIESASAGHLTLVVMSVVAAIFTPLVLLYQGWTYWVFRQRLSRPPVGPAAADAPDHGVPGSSGRAPRPVGLPGETGR
ncbi:MAG: cytochrome d ubiquinol oxidase subunit II [Actinomycetota bacterium]|nr:cytochrome d ubiquinol oxidase subunit II [Actinomycetota bacterium]